jgi:hypothetical protein
MKRNWFLSVGTIGLLLTVAACDDSNKISGPKGQEAFRTYVSIGTSLTMGVESDGVLYTSQQQAWPNLLAHMAFGRFSQPLIQGPGCFSPLIAPLQFNRRLSGISAGANPAASIPDTTCALFPNITLPTNDVGIDGATTYDALYVTPETTVVETVKRRRQYRVVLPPGTTQVTAMMRQKPTLVSVDLGPNEVLGVVSGLLFARAGYRGAAATGTYIPNSVWQPVYDKVIDSVKKTGAKALLVGVPNTSGFVSLRKGNELYADSATFRNNFNVIISSDCNGNDNSIFVPLKVTGAVGAAAGGTTQTISCTDTPGAQDNILTPSDVAAVDAIIAGMNSHMQTVAQANGWAYVDMATVWAQWVGRRGPFSVAKLFSCVRPYGQYVSLDGIHPNVEGYQEMANAAADALNANYGFEIPTNPVTQLTPAQLCGP